MHKHSVVVVAATMFSRATGSMEPLVAVGLSATVLLSAFIFARGRRWGGT